MASYVNPPGGDIEGWVKSNGKEASAIEYALIPNGYLPVILQDEGYRKIAAIAHDKNELNRQLMVVAISVKGRRTTRECD